MMRLPRFTYARPRTVSEAVAILASEGPRAALVAGGTDLWPNMKRRQREPGIVVSVGRIDALRGLTWNADGALVVGAGEILRGLERDGRLADDLPALHTAIRSISTPLLRNMGTIGGNVCLDTRCNYLDQSWEWRRTIDFCMKCEGEICWTAPGSDRCLAVNSADTVPVLIAMGAKVRLEGPDGRREIPLADLYRDDGIAWLAKAPEEVLVEIEIPAQGAAKSVYRKVRRRGSFDFPVAAVALRVTMDGDRVSEAVIVLNAIASAPRLADEAGGVLRGERLDAERIDEAARLAAKIAKPLDNTDHQHSWRRTMIQVETKRGLVALKAALGG